MAKSTVQAVHLNIPKREWLAAKHAAVDRGISATDVIVEALRKFLKLNVDK